MVNEYQSEVLMDFAGYVKANHATIYEKMIERGGRMGDENYSHTEYRYEILEKYISYVKKAELNKKEMLKEETNKSFCVKTCEVKYTINVKYSESLKKYSYFQGDSGGLEEARTAGIYVDAVLRTIFPQLY